MKVLLIALFFATISGTIHCVDQDMHASSTEKIFLNPVSVAAGTYTVGSAAFCAAGVLLEQYSGATSIDFYTKIMNNQDPFSGSKSKYYASKLALHSYSLSSAFFAPLQSLYWSIAKPISCAKNIIIAASMLKKTTIASNVYSLKKSKKISQYALRRTPFYATIGFGVLPYTYAKCLQHTQFQQTSE